MKKMNLHKRNQITQILTNYSIRDILNELKDLGFEDPLSAFDDSQEEREMLEAMVESEEFIDEDSREYLILPKLELLTMLFTAELEEKFSSRMHESDQAPRAKILHFPAQQKSGRVYQLKLTLIGAMTPIWRRVEIPSHFSFADLHTVIQIVFDWENSRLHEFFDGSRRISAEISADSLHEEHTLIQHVLTEEKQKIGYVYDFSSHWEIQITLEKIITASAEVPSIIGGKRTAPPAECGGIHRYESMREAALDKTHPDHQSMKDRAADFGLVDENGEYDEPEFDSEDISEINDILKEWNTLKI